MVPSPKYRNTEVQKYRDTEMQDPWTMTGTQQISNGVKWTTLEHFFRLWIWCEGGDWTWVCGTRFSWHISLDSTISLRLLSVLQFVHGFSIWHGMVLFYSILAKITDSLLGMRITTSYWPWWLHSLTSIGFLACDSWGQDSQIYFSSQISTGHHTSLIIGPRGMQGPNKREKISGQRLWIRWEKERKKWHNICQFVNHRSATF